MQINYLIHELNGELVLERNTKMGKYENIVLNGIYLENTDIGTKIVYDYNAPLSIQKYIKSSDPLFVEVPGDIGDVPEEVLVIPFVGVMLTVSMLLDIGIEVSSLDRTFYDSISKLQAIYQSMYPKAGLHLSVQVKSTRLCHYQSNGKKALFFTGGVDATSALIELSGENVELLNIWGGDLRLTDSASHVELEHYLSSIQAVTGLEYHFIKTNAREMFEENALGDVCLKLLGRSKNHGWWASIAHILSMTTTVAPWAYKHKIGQHYIGSSYNPKETLTFDSNNKEFINSIRYSSAIFSIVDEQVGRNEKIGKIVQYKEKSEVPIQLKVCWQRQAGVNCSNCEKCYRTIMSIIANHGDPNVFGFKVDSLVIQKIKKFLSTNLVSTAFWKPIQDMFLSDREYWESNSQMNWILTLKLNSAQIYFIKLKQKFMDR